MKKLLKIQYLPFLNLGVGLVGLLLQALLMRTLDDRGLAEGQSPLHILAWAFAIAVLTGNAVAVFKLDGHNRYADNFPPSPVGGIGSFLLACAVLWAIFTHWEPYGDFLFHLWRATAVLAVPGLVFSGVCRIRGKRPSIWAHGMVFLFFASQLVRSCQVWSREPQLELYGFSMFGCICLMLSAYYRTAFDGGIGRRRMQLFMGLAAGMLCLMAIPGTADWPVYLTGSLWALSNLCVLTPPRRHHRTAPAAPEQE